MVLLFNYRCTLLFDPLKANQNNTLWNVSPCKYKFAIQWLANMLTRAYTYGTSIQLGTHIMHFNPLGWHLVIRQNICESPDIHHFRSRNFRRRFGTHFCGEFFWSNLYGLTQHGCLEKLMNYKKHTVFMVRKARHPRILCCKKVFILKDWWEVGVTVPNWAEIDPFRAKLSRSGSSIVQS